MALTDVGRVLLGPATGYPAAGALSVSTLTLNDADNSAAGIFRAPKAGTIDRVIINVSAKTGTSSTVLYNIGVVTVDSSGNPTTTAYGGSAIETRSVTAISTGQNIITLATPATAAEDDVFAVRVWPEGTVAPDASFSVALRTRVVTANSQMPYAADWATAWTKNANYPCLTAQYNAASGDTYVGAALGGGAVVTSAFGSGSAPNEIGALFQVPFDCTCVGMGWFHRQTTLAATGRMGLYDNTGALQRNGTYPAGAAASTAQYGASEVEWAGYDLAASTNYRLGHLATSADTRQHAELTLGSSAQRAALPQGPLWQRTSRTNSGDTGSWTEVVAAVPLVYLILSHIDFTVTGGGGTGGARGRIF